jgi:glycerophosphoryl diester phosphodiesterase
MRKLFPRPLILGHRGAPLDAPENTLRSFALALRRGADGVELDVRRARDGVPVVIHDDTLRRTFGVDERVDQHPWSALQRLTDAQLPSLAQAAAWAASAGAWLNVELKEAGAEAATLQVLREAGLLSRCFLSSFDPAVVEEVGRLDPEVPRFLLVERWHEDAQEALARSGAHGVCLEVGAASALNLEVLRNDDLPVVVWTVNDRDRIHELLAAGVAAVITNHPSLAAEARK